MNRDRKPFDEEIFLEACRNNGIEFPENAKDGSVGELFLRDKDGNLFKVEDDYNPFI